MNAQRLAPRPARTPALLNPLDPQLEEERRDEDDALLAPMNYWLPGELTVQPLFFDRLELPQDYDAAP